MTRVPRPLLPVLLFCALLLPAAPAAGLPTLNDLVHGAGNASSIQLFADDLTSVEGGLYDKNRVCTDCILRITIASGTVTVVENGVPATLAPGAYEIRELQGTFSFTSKGLHSADFRIEGNGKVNLL